MFGKRLKGEENRRAIKRDRKKQVKGFIGGNKTKSLVFLVIAKKHEMVHRKKKRNGNFGKWIFLND